MRAQHAVHPSAPPLDPATLSALLAHDPPGAAQALAALDDAARQTLAHAQARLPTRQGTAVTAAALLVEWAWLIRAARDLGVLPPEPGQEHHRGTETLRSLEPLCLCASVVHLLAPSERRAAR